MFTEPCFSVLTPSYNPGTWIKCCHASLKDQQGVVVQHLVQDNCSSDGTIDWLGEVSGLHAVIEMDDGMYDALNRAWRRASGEYVLHLNSDEQLLPGALAAVGECFICNPDADVVIGGTLILLATGELASYRKPVKPSMAVLLTSHHPVPTCSIFLRRQSFGNRPYFMDPGFRIISDALFMMDVLRERKKIVLLQRYTSVFFWTGKNMGLTQSQQAREEYRYQMALAPFWKRLAGPGIRAAFHLKKLLLGHYRREPVSYAVYMPDDPLCRKQFHVARASGVYRPGRTCEE